MAKKFERLLSAMLAVLMCFSILSIPAFAEGENSVASENISKTADVLDANDQTDVTLSVPSSVDVLGSDIIYIVGSYATNSDGTPNVKGDVLISSLVETIREIVEMGGHVNFGMVPFSSDNVVAMPLTAINETNIDELPEMIANALATCEALYDGVNMENALIKSKKMFSESELAAYPDRQHLVMITSGLTYFFNSGENNEYVSTVPVNFVYGENNAKALFYMNKAWQRARLNQTNTYAIPEGIVAEYNANPDKYENVWDCYWTYIDAWVKADIAAGDNALYKAATVESGNFINWYNSGMYHSNQTNFKYSGHGAIISGTTEADIANAVTLTPGANPVKNSSAAHAILYERAMWEAYEYAKENIIAPGINFYPIYNALSYQYTNGVWSDGRVNENGKSYNYGVGWTNQYIGHSFVDMLAGGEGEAVKYDKQGDKTFFGPIKDKILYYCAAGSFVEDYIGYDAVEGNFEFITDASVITLKKGDYAYVTKQIAPRNNADFSCSFSMDENSEPTFWLDYYRGNGTDTERFVWTFGENISRTHPVALTYKLQLTEKSEEAGVHYVDTNISATLYPVDSNGKEGDPQLFPVPSVSYEVVEISLEGEKSSSLINRGENRFQVNVKVPGGDADVSHDEVILMVDGSYSMDNEWPAMKEAINTIGKTVLDGDGHTQLTLMAFGMGDNIVLEHVKDVESLASALGALPGNLLYGRSSTNCEAGFNGVAEYIKNHDDTLGQVDVIFISDGNINTDETLRAFDANWQTWTKFGALVVAQEAFGGTVSNGTNLPDAFAMFEARFAGATREEIVERAFGGEVSDEEFLAFAEQLWTDVYTYSGLTRGTAYPVSVAERAFVKYDKEKGTYIQDLFYYTTYKSAYVTYGDRWTRTPAAANALASMSKVEAMYVVDYDSYTSWMDTGITSEKSTFVTSNGITGLCDALKETLAEIAKTPVNDVVITDYMSKWVDLDPDTLQIVDNSTGKTIWTVKEGWLINEKRPTSQENPVVVELVDPSDYENGGDAVVGNTNGNIYKLTWYVKDGALLRSDNFSLVYEVITDVWEEGFKTEVNYPANGNTDLNYKDENGKDYIKEIEVPEVDGVLYDVDIVLALGAGIAQYDADSTKGTNTYDSIVNIVEPLVKAGINVKLGLVAVEHYDDVAMPLTELTKNNYLDVIQGGLAAIQAMPAGPTNLHGNIVAAKEMLDADTSVPAANKFFHVIATGRTYNFDNAEGVPTTIINKIALSGNTYYYWGHYLWQSQRGGHTSLYMIPARYNNDFNAYWADVCKWVEADGDTYAYSFTDAYNTADPQWFNTFFAANSTDAKALKLASSRFGWILGDLTNSGLAGIGSGSNPQNALNYERAQYEAWKAYNEMKDAGYNCYALCSESTSYQNGSPYIQIVKYTGTSTLQLGHSFMNFLAGESQGYVAPLLFVMTDPNTGASEMAKNFFAPVDVDKLVKSESEPESESDEPELRLPMFSTAPAVDPSELKILVQPTDASASIGEKVSTSVVAQGEGLKYQWYFCNAGTDVFYASSTKTATYSVEMTAARANRELYCVITDANGNVAITDTVKLIPVVSTELKILTQPVDASASFGKTATVSVKAQGEGLKYQWYIKNAGSSTFSASSTKTAEYSVEMTNARANRELYCVITDAFGNSVTTDTVKLLPVATTELKILTQPVDGSAALNKVVNVSVVAQGEGLKYQWYIKNAGSSTFSASSTKVATYATTLTKERVDRELYCVITDAYGNVAVTDTVKLIRVPSAELKILTQPVDGSAALNKVVTVTVKAQGEGLKYQWYIKNAGSSTFSASSTKVATYATTLTKERVDRELYCVITDAFGNTVTTDTVVLKRAD